MKKYLIIGIILGLSSIPSISQLKFTTTSNLGIGTSNPLSSLSVKGNGYTQYTAAFNSDYSGVYGGIHIYHEPITNTYNYGLISVIDNNAIYGTKLIAIQATANQASTSGKATYGVAGYAGNGIAGSNYGVMGKLVGTRNGTGILGLDYNHSEPSVGGNYAGYFRGNMKCEDTIFALEFVDLTSDIRAKKDIRPLGNNNIEKVKQLNAIRYKLKSPSELPAELQNLSDTTKYSKADDIKYSVERIGLSAQEVQLVYPELVSKDIRGKLTLNYIDLIPILIESIKEQHELIESLKSELVSLKGVQLNQSLTSIEGSMPSKNKDATLSQNAPNPFSEETKIKYSIPNIRTIAMINVYDLQGGQVRSFRISHSGDGEIIIPGSDLNPGMYIYNLIVDNKEIISRQMILTNKLN